jgi:non-heme chloroperoxidase
MPHTARLPTGVRLEYVERGAPDGAPIVFLHGVTDSCRSFERVLPLLPPHLRAFAISMRGHGDSGRPSAGYRLTDMSGDLLAFMNAMRLPSATIVGHSMGASIAQRFAIDRPSRVSALVLMGAFATFQGEGLRDFVTASILPLRDPIAPSFARAWQQSTLARPMDPTHLEAVILETLKVPAFVWHAAFEGFLQTADMVDALRAVTVPTLLMWGDRDTYADRTGQERLLAAIPDSRLVVYEAAGHAFHWEDPATCAAELASFASEGARERGFRREPDDVTSFGSSGACAAGWPRAARRPIPRESA